MRRGPRSIATLLCLGILIALSHEAAAQEKTQDPPALLLIMDSSGSMKADDGTGRPKIRSAKAALRGLVARLPDDADVGLRVYGHRVPNTDRMRGCRDTELVAPVAPLDRARLNSAISSFEAKGWTPIGLSPAGCRRPPAGGRSNHHPRLGRYRYVRAAPTLRGCASPYAARHRHHHRDGRLPGQLQGAQ